MEHKVDIAFVLSFDSFVQNYQPGSPEYGRVTKVCGWFESIGTLYQQDLLSGELIFDWLTLELPWRRLKNFAKCVLYLFQNLLKQSIFNDFSFF